MPTIAQIADVTAAYPALTAAQLADLPAALAAASAACQRYVGGYQLTRSAFDEEHTPGETRTVRLRHWPVASVQRAQADLAAWLRVSATGFQRATAALATTGDPGSLIPTGIALADVSSGVPASTLVDFAAHATVQAVAAAISGVPGWSAVAAPGAGAMASADFRPVQGPGGCLVTPTSFWGYSTDLASDGWDLVPETGRIYLGQARRDAYSYPDRTWGSDPRYGKVRLVYTAGFSSPPPDAVRACVLTVKHIFDSQQFTSALKSMTAGNVSWERAAPLFGLPDAAKSWLGQFGGGAVRLS